MTLEQKGDRNLEIARFIDSDDFEKLSGFPKQHLCSTIINRLYYGIYLIGKQRLLQKDNSINAKYKALSSSSTLTERYRESRVLELLRQNKDSLLHIAEQPPYIIITEE